MLDTIGHDIAKVLAILFVIGLLIIVFQFTILNSIDLSTALEKVVLQIIPTEVTIITIFSNHPILMLIILFFFIIYVKPNQRNS
jgi:uncharacterized BrkB/YihY/UPF0761 family membrane protein